MKKYFIPMLMLCLMQSGIMKAEDTDLTTVDNVIYVAPQTVIAGETVTLSVCMKNTAAIRGFQFDLYLPDGMTAVKNSKGRYVCTLTGDRLEADDEHTLTVAEQSDGGIRFLCGSQYDETFTGSEGEIATIQVKVAATLESGSYPVQLKNMKLTETDISRFYEHESVETTLTVTTTTGVDLTSALSRGERVCYDLKGQRVAAPQQGVYVVGGKKKVFK